MPDWLFPAIFYGLAIVILAVLLTEVDSTVTQTRGVSTEDIPPEEDSSPDPDAA